MFRCATDRCFHNAVLARFVSKGKVLPIARGRGMYQQGMQDALDRLDHGDWVHGLCVLLKRNQARL